MVRPKNDSRIDLDDFGEIEMQMDIKITQERPP
jgi:hypothetical protein